MSRERDPVANANAVLTLAEGLETWGRADQCLAAQQLEKFFKDEATQSGPPAADDGSPEGQYFRWVQETRRLFRQKLLRCVASADNSTVGLLCDVVMKMLVSQRIGDFDNDLYYLLMATLLRSGPREEALGALCSRYGGYADVRYFTFKAVAKLCTEQLLEDSTSLFTNVKMVLETLPKTLEACQSGDGILKSWSGISEAGGAVAAVSGFPSQRKRKRAAQGEAPHGFKWADPKEQQRQFSSAWNHFLALDLPDSILLDILPKLSTEVMPYLTSPLTLSDFFTHALDKGGSCGVLALHGIFLLMTQHNLEYPDFYKRVYGLLTPDVFDRVDRAAFFRLLDSFFRSRWVPAYTVAAFVKRCARLALALSPGGAMVCVTLMHNLIRRHPSCHVLLDRPRRRHPVQLSDWDAFDVFDPDAGDPGQSRAIESSLWETEALGNHWCRQVAAHARILLRDLTLRARSADEKIDRVVNLSYTSLIEQNLRRVDGAPPVTSVRFFDTDLEEAF